MSKRNENRPGYKKTKVGWIPGEWAVLKLVDVAAINPDTLNGKTSTSYCFYYLDLSSIKEGIVQLPSQRISFSDAPCRARRRVCKGDVLLATVRPNLKGFAYIGFDANSLICSTGFAVLRSKKGFDARFIYYCLYSRESSLYFYGCVVGSGYPALNNSDVERLRIPGPSLPEQKKIAEILSAWDEAIELTRKLIDAKKRRKKALMQQLLTEKKRLPGFSKTWKEYYLGVLFDERKEIRCDHLPLLAITGDRGVIPASEIERKDSSSSDKSKYKRIAPGDIGYNTMRMWQGVSAVSDLEGIVSPAYTICVPKKGAYTKFMGYFFKFAPIVNLFRRYSQGLVNDTLNLKFNNFARIKVKIPDADEQISIAKVLSTADREIKALEKKLTALEKQKRGLMQKLLTGEIRVKT